MSSNYATKRPILTIAKNIPEAPNGKTLPLLKITLCLTKPNPGRIRI